MIVFGVLSLFLSIDVLDFCIIVIAPWLFDVRLSNPTAIFVNFKYFAELIAVDRYSSRQPNYIVLPV